MLNASPADEDAYVRDADNERAHQLEMAKVNAERETTLARIASANADERRVWFAWILAGLAVSAIIGGIIVALTWSAHRDREQSGRDQARRAQVAEMCIREGNIWFDGNCIPAKKG